MTLNMIIEAEFADDAVAAQAANLIAHVVETMADSYEIGATPRSVVKAAQGLWEAVPPWHHVTAAALRRMAAHFAP